MSRFRTPGWRERLGRALPPLLPPPACRSSSSHGAPKLLDRTVVSIAGLGAAGDLRGRLDVQRRG